MVKGLCCCVVLDLLSFPELWLCRLQTSLPRNNINSSNYADSNLYILVVCLHSMHGLSDSTVILSGSQSTLIHFVKNYSSDWEIEIRCTLEARGFYRHSKEWRQSDMNK